MPWFNRVQSHATDPVYAHQVGRLVGATEMLVSYLELHGDRPMRGMAARADEVLSYFTGHKLKDFHEQRTEIKSDALPPPPPSEQPTLVVPPPSESG